MSLGDGESLKLASITDAGSGSVQEKKGAAQEDH